MTFSIWTKLLFLFISIELPLENVDNFSSVDKVLRFRHVSEKSVSLGAEGSLILHFVDQKLSEA